MLSPTAIVLLRESIEASIGRKLRTPKDFDILAESIFKKLHQHISPTTLKRLWGYLHDTSSSPRPSTLDLLAQFIDYPSFADFCADINPAPSLERSEAPSLTGGRGAGLPTPSPNEAPSPDEAAVPEGAPSGIPSPPKKKHFSLFILSLFILSLFLLLIAIPFVIRDLHSPQPDILHRGTKFTCQEDYLKLFDVALDEYTPYWIQHPKYPYIYFWAPEYHHHVWHNEGDPTRLMPTITTYYHPDDYPTDSASLAKLAQYNKERYTNALRNRSVLITFMKNLFDTTYVYLGVYRLASQSDSTRQIWERAQDDLDINHLEYLEEYHE